MDSSALVSKHRPGYFTPKIRFTQQEDDLLRSLVGRFGADDWRTIASHMKTRNQRQCRERWRNYLSPQVSDPQEWTPEEESRLTDLYSIIGSRWTLLASHFPGRSIINVKNRVTVLERRERRMMSVREELTRALEQTEDTSEAILTPKAQSAELEQERVNQADPFRFLAGMGETFDALFDEPSTYASSFNHFFK